MAKKRDVIIAVIIGGAFVVFLGLVVLIFIGLMSGTGDDGLTSGFGDKIGVIEVYGAIYEHNGREIVKQIDAQRCADLRNMERAP